MCFSDTVSFEEAVTRTLQLSPKLRIADSEISEKAGAKVQSALLPNPVAGYSVENVLGNRKANSNWNGWESAESRYEIGQLIELGGKRGFRHQIATFQYYAAQAGYDAQRLSILNQLLKLFVLLSAAQENLELAVDQMRIAEEVSKTVSAKVEAGKVSLIQQNKAEIALSAAQINMKRAKTNFYDNKEKLAVLWGRPYPDFEKVEFPFYEIAPPTPIQTYLTNLKSSPELVKSQMQHLASIENLNLQKSLAIPDVTITIGCKTTRDTKNKGVIFGVSVPIPIFDQNQGNVQNAKAQTDKAHDQSVILELMLRNKIIISHNKLVRAYDEAEQVKATVLKAAEQSFELAKEGYQEGKFEYLDMLDSQKTLFEVRERYIQALLSYHQGIADLEYLNTQEEES